MRFRLLAIYLVLCCGLFGTATMRANEDAAKNGNLPNFHELFGLIRSNLTSIGEADLNRAAVIGLLSQLPNQVVLMTNAPSGTQTSDRVLVAKTAVFDRAFAYLRLNAVEPGLARTFERAFDPLRSSNNLNGLVLDLRFADGDSYAEAAEVADLFLNTEQTLLKWGDSIKRSTTKTNAFERPVIALVNHQTAGAAEALAAVLRCADVSLIVGNSTAGHTQAFKEFTLGNGQKIRIASGRIEVCEGQPLSEGGITPDIRVNVSEEAERLYLEDPYRTLPKIPGPRVKASAPGEGPSSSTGDATSRRRMNESILIRRSREDGETNSDAASAPAEAPPLTVVQDPALARALDVLKGLALVKGRR